MLKIQLTNEFRQQINFLIVNQHNYKDDHSVGWISARYDQSDAAFGACLQA